MSVKKDPTGRHFIQLEVEVPGTPEEVWAAIATGPGISSWLVPAEMEERDGKPVSVKLNFGPGMENSSVVTEWKPPFQWSTQSEGWTPGSPPIANEWSVEAREGGKCLVRIVQSLFASTDDWDYQLEGAEYGWPGFLQNLRLYLTHFRGQRSATMKWVIPVSDSEGIAWKRLLSACGLTGKSVGESWIASERVPSFGGVVEHLSEKPYDALLRVNQPAPGIAALGAFDCGGQCMIALGFYLYGDQASDHVMRETPLWEQWFQENFPLPVASNPGKA